MKKIGHRKSNIDNARAFTLIELLVVIAVIAVIAGFTVPALNGVKRTQFRRTASGELEQIAAALDRYKAKYGFYPPANTNNFLLPPLYYELSGVTNNGAYFVRWTAVLGFPSAIPAMTCRLPTVWPDLSIAPKAVARMRCWLKIFCPA